MHDDVRVGQPLTISTPRNKFPLDETATHSTLVAGGIGLTPLLSMAHRLTALHAEFTLHVCARSPDVTPFATLLESDPLATHCQLHHDGGDPRRGLDVVTLLAETHPGHHVYCCGPTGLMAAVDVATAHWPPGTVHFEHFQPTDTPPNGNIPFDVELARSGRILHVPPDATILAVLLENGVRVASSCQEGTCGTCIQRVIAGEPDHRDVVLTSAERSSGEMITVCCSRALSDRLVLDL